MKILIFILLMLFAQDVYNQFYDPACVTCGPWFLTDEYDICSCPPNSVKIKRPFPHGDHFHMGQCCEFREVKCVPNIDCPPNKHIERDIRPKCKCVCNNLDIVICHNLTVLNTKTCECECPPDAAKKCAGNQYLDRKTCSCICKQPCHDCSGSQIWNNNTCTCTCQKKRSCTPKTQFFNEQSCQCECKQRERHCCDKSEKYFDHHTCDCECIQVKKCYKSVWNPYTCRCDEYDAIDDPKNWET